MKIKSVNPLEYYARQSPITDPGKYAELFENLPIDIPTLCKIVQGIMIHHASADLRGLRLTDKWKEDVELRYVAELLARVLELDDHPLTIIRPPERRLAIKCREFAIMLCAMLRHQGIPARARCGFAKYFGECPDSTSDFNVDHWVCEYRKADEQRWVLVDAEIDDIERKCCHIKIDTHDVARDQFLVAGKAWQLCRAGEADPDRFGHDLEGMHGMWYIQSQLVRDLACLNKIELLEWDTWALGDADPDKNPSEEDIALLDHVAALTQADNKEFPEMRSLYENDTRLRVPPIIRSYTRDGVRTVELVHK